MGFPPMPPGQPPPGMQPPAPPPPMGAPADPNMPAPPAPGMEEEELFDVTGVEVELPEESIVEGERVPGSGSSTIRLTPGQRDKLAYRLNDIIEANRQMMQQRREREEEISNAYNLIPDVKQAGQHPGAARMCSSLLRRYSTQTASRLSAGLMENRPWMSVEVSAPHSDDEDTVERLAEADATQTFLDSYVDVMELDMVIPEEISQSTLLGTVFTLIEWEQVEEEYRYFDEDETLRTADRKHGRVKWTPLRNPDVVCWPLHEKDVKRMKLIGHRTHMIEADFMDFFAERGVDKAILDEIAASEGFHRSETQEEDLGRQEIRTPSNTPFDGQIEIHSLWGKFRLPDQAKNTKFQAFYHDPTRTVLWIGHNTLNAQRPPYFRQTHWEEAGSVWATGVGHDSVYHVAADSSMWNMEVDNLKIVGNHIIQVPAGGEAEANTNEIYPGKVVVVDEGELIQSIPMGGSLDQLVAARQRNAQDAAMAAGVPAVLEGVGDPTMKSGATASAHASLVSQASHRSGHIDRNLRRAYSEKFMFCLMLLQQYAPDGVFYEIVDPETADLLVRQKFRVPTGDLERNFRITVRSPSAASNREAQQQQILLIWNFAKEQAQLLVEFGETFYGGDQAGLQEALHDAGKLVVNTFAQIIDLHELKGLEAPVMDDPSPIEEQYNELYTQFQEVQQQLQQLQQEKQQAEQMQQMQMSGGAPPTPPGAGPPAPGGGAPPPMPPQQGPMQ